MSEIALLEAVRNRLRLQLDYRDNECEIEFDETPPAAVGRVYVTVLPGGWAPGPTNDPGGGVIDEIYGVDVWVVMRAVRQPRDRRRSLFLDNTEGLNQRLRAISAQIHFNYALMQAANALIDNDVSTEKFIHPLTFAGVDPRPREVGSEVFAAMAGEPAAGLSRTIRFRNARRIQYQSSQV